MSLINAHWLVHVPPGLTIGKPYFVHTVWDPQDQQRS